LGSESEETMAFASLRDFMEQLERDGELTRVSKPVSTALEMTEIQTRLLAEGGPAVLFENPLRDDGTPSDMPVLVNLFGTVERVAAGMARKPEELRKFGEQLAFLRQPEPPGGWREALQMLPMIKSVFAMKPKLVSNAPCQEVVLTGDDIDLAKLPIQSCWPDEPAPLITWPLVVTEGPGRTNLGIYRMQVTGKNTTLMRWLKHRGGAQAHAIATGESIPAAAVIGADPATIIGINFGISIRRVVARQESRAR
jgi:4-hydroxy-3-polyprenylbenzoate decarboxylase